MFEPASKVRSLCAPSVYSDRGCALLHHNRSRGTSDSVFRRVEVEGAAFALTSRFPERGFLEPLLVWARSQACHQASVFSNDHSGYLSLVRLDLLVSASWDILPRNVLPLDTHNSGVRTLFSRFWKNSLNYLCLDY